MSLLNAIKDMEEAAVTINTTINSEKTISNTENEISNVFLFRAVKDSKSSTVIAIGADENQAGSDYNNGEGIWCDFTFTQMPEIALNKDSQMVINDFNQWLQLNSPYNDYLEVFEYNFKMFRVLNDKIVMKTETQIKAMIDEAKAIISEKYKNYIRPDVIDNDIGEENILEQELGTIVEEEVEHISLFDAMKRIE